MTWTHQQMLQIEHVCTDIAKTLQETGASTEMCAAAVMTTMARIAVLSLENDEYVIDQFRKTLLANRQAIIPDAAAGGAA